MRKLITSNHWHKANAKSQLAKQVSNLAEKLGALYRTVDSKSKLVKSRKLKIEATTVSIKITRFDGGSHENFVFYS